VNARWLGFVAFASACIIPDREITFEGGPDNPSAVRILERPPITDQMSAICNAPPRKFPGLPDLGFCPPARRSLPSGLVESPDGGPFCICDGGDSRAIDAFTIYAEDADVVGDSARDTLRGVFLLDPDPSSDEPPEPAFIPYSPLVEGEEIEELHDADPIGGRTAPGQARDVPPQWAFRIDDSSGKVDLCNTDDLEPGLHNLQFIVTDREWFAAPHPDLNPDDDIVPETSTPQPGVPDIANGASYAVVNFVFECVDPLDDTHPRSDECMCDG
jgi:hypothetical protein